MVITLLTVVVVCILLVWLYIAKIGLCGIFIFCFNFSAFFLIGIKFVVVVVVIVSRVMELNSRKFSRRLKTDVRTLSASPHP